MRIAEALASLSSGHIVFTEDSAREICAAFNVSFPEDRVMSWQSQQDAFDCYGFVPRIDAPGTGMDDLELSYHIAGQLGLGAPGIAFMGRGYQARVNVRAITE